jgi:hypothetical protein
MRLRHTGIHTCDVLKWHLEPARQGEELVGSTGSSRLVYGLSPASPNDGHT